MSLSNYGENRMLSLFRGAGTFYLALFTSDPGEEGSGTEVSGGAYARQPVTFGLPDGGSMASSAAVEFPIITADWGTVSHWGLFDAATGGNLWWYGSITTPRQLLSGDIYRVPAGNLTLSMD